MITIVNNTDIRKMTTFGLPAECGRLIEYDTPDDLTELHRSGLISRDVLPIGGGSNLLFTTRRYDGTVLHCRNREVTFTDCHDGNVSVTAAAGTVLDELCRRSCEAGLWGPENLSGIPGEAGGAAVQNVGAYGTEFKDIVKQVRCFDLSDGTFRDFTAEECRYGYRTSIFKHMPRLIVTEVTLNLTRRPSPVLRYAALNEKFGHMPPTALTPEMMRRAVTELRDAKLPSPSAVGSAGSFFKNPVISAERYTGLQKRINNPVPGHQLPSGEVKLSAAWLIDKAGCKALTAGGAGVWQKQPLVIVNADGNATGADIVALEDAIRRRVKEMFDIDITPEVVHIS